MIGAITWAVTWAGILAAWAVLAGLVAATPAGAVDDRPLASVGPSRFIHADPSTQGEVSITVETYVPPACQTRACPLVISMHGLTRNAAAARDNWTAPADRHGLVIAAPEFDRERFPTRFYQRGGVQNEPDRGKWLYATIERLFDALKASGRVEGETYVLFGHSAGAQFVHRMVVLMPDARFSTAISANAGYYTLPVPASQAQGRTFPYSLGNTPVTEPSLRRAFARRLLVLLGDQDNDPAHDQLNTGEGANAQGPHRLARGLFFMETATAVARSLDVSLAWRLEIVAGVAHEQRKMAAAAALAVFGTR
jgi:pimeloyl-ACP methyl ester carboxylesterase